MTVEILSVDYHAPHPDGPRGSLESPRVGDRLTSHLLTIAGSLIQPDMSITGVELARESGSFRYFPAVPDEPAVRFVAQASVAGSGTALAVDIRAVLRDRRRIGLATVNGRRIGGGSAAEATVSVVIPCYRQAHYLGEAIESSLAQSIAKLEIIVVDDGSDDNTVAVASRYPGVRYVRQENRGLAAARNAGLYASTGDYLVFLDSDDRLLPHAIETGLSHLMRDPAAAVAAGRVVNIDSNGAPLPTPEQIVPVDPYSDLLLGCFIWAPCSVVFRRQFLQSSGAFDTSVDASADFEVYLRAAREGLLIVHPAPVAEYRRHSSSMNRDPLLIHRSELRVLREQKRHAHAITGGSAMLEAGVRRSREYHGAVLAERVAQQLAVGHWGKSVRSLLLLMRYYPFGAKDALKKGLRLSRLGQKSPLRS